MPCESTAQNRARRSVKFPLKLSGMLPINLLETIRLLDAGKGQRGEWRQPP